MPKIIDTVVDFSGNRLTNVGNAIELTDAVTLGQLLNLLSSLSPSQLGATLQTITDDALEVYTDNDGADYFDSIPL